MITRPRLVMITSLRTLGRPRSSIFGMVVVITRRTMPTFACWTKALTRNRPIPAGLIAKLHSLLASNSAACLSFMIERARSTVCAGVSGWFETGVILPSILIAGGNPTVMKRSEALFVSISRSRSYMNLVACSRSMLSSAKCVDPPSAREIVLVGRFPARLASRDHVAPHQFLEILVERLHAEGLAGLDRRVHLRDLVLADQIADRRRSDHDLVRRDAPGAVLGLAQRLRDHRAQALRNHRAHHLLFRGRKHVDDAVYRLGRGARMQRSEHQVARLGAGQGEAYRLQIAHLAHEDHVGVFAQCAAQRIGERERVRADLSLVDEAFLRVVHKLDRVLDRQDVALLVLVDMIDD